MDTTAILGAVAHPGGLLVRRPELTVGVVRAVSTLSALEIELLARQPLDRRSALERQHDIRAGRPNPVAPRRLLPVYDEGIDLRVGRLDHTGRVRWEYVRSSSGSSGDHHLGANGPTHRAVFRFPPAFDEMSLVLAWPEIGFPETVITLPLPDRTTVERATTTIWRAPLDTRPVPEGLTHHTVPWQRPPAIEEGTIVAPPRVLHRRDHEAAVVISRLTAVGPTLSMELLSIAQGDSANAVIARAFAREQPVPGLSDDPAQLRAMGPDASVAVLRGHEAVWIKPGDGSSSGGEQSFSSLRELTLHRPQDDLLDLVVAWPLAGLHDVRVHVPLTGLSTHGTA
ncbi:hypothetical protein [Nocardia sp. NRRL S-836]|uniref:hypothetical protein n=1 Tax=Nocardia sp. NRRL S-836 TaxID=1519492 RepID=UPI0006AF7C4C|nr:hypothetical protein [Nocardia sp. NRRL S-836]KOV90065.1 hypothetical protein ADL03_01595 [Nocardia sp. NRRL S-836]